MDDLKELISCYSREELGPKLLAEKDVEKKDEMKGQLLAFSDFETILKSFEGKDLVKLRNYLELFDSYDENLNLFVNLAEERAERVVGSKILALGVLKSNLMEYLNNYAGIDDGVSDDKTAEKTDAEGVAAESQIPPKRKSRK